MALLIPARPSALTLSSRSLSRSRQGLLSSCLTVKVNHDFSKSYCSLYLSSTPLEKRQITLWRCLFCWTFPRQLVENAQLVDMADCSQLALDSNCNQTWSSQPRGMPEFQMCMEHHSIEVLLTSSKKNNKLAILLPYLTTCLLLVQMPVQGAFSMAKCSIWEQGMPHTTC